MSVSSAISAPVHYVSPRAHIRKSVRGARLSGNFSARRGRYVARGAERRGRARIARLGSAYIGGIRNQPAAVAAELDLPPRLFPVFGLVVGTPDPARPAGVKPRLPHESVLFHETYGWTERQRSAARAYDIRLRSFQREQGMAEREWAELAGDRTSGPASMAGRHVLRSVLADLGFALRCQSAQLPRLHTAASPLPDSGAIRLAANMGIAISHEATG